MENSFLGILNQSLASLELKMKNVISGRLNLLSSQSTNQFQKPVDCKYSQTDEVWFLGPLKDVFDQSLSVLSDSVSEEDMLDAPEPPIETSEMESNVDSFYDVGAGDWDWIHLSNISTCTTQFNICDFVRLEFGLRSVICKMLIKKSEQPQDLRFLCFKVCVKRKYVADLLVKRRWPTGVRIRKFDAMENRDIL